MFGGNPLENMLISSQLGKALQKKRKKSSKDFLDSKKASEVIRKMNEDIIEEMSAFGLHADIVKREEEIEIMYPVPGVNDPDAINLTATKTPNSPSDTHKIFLQVNWGDSWEYLEEGELLQEGIKKPNEGSSENTITLNLTDVEPNLEDVKAELNSGLLKVSIPFKEKNEENEKWKIDIQ